MTLLSNLRDIREGRYDGKGFDSAEVIDILDDNRLVNIYDSIGALPVTNLEAGTEAYVSSTSRYYITNGTGWYQITMTLNNPSDSAGDNEWDMWAMKTGASATSAWNTENSPANGYMQFAADRYTGPLAGPYSQEHTLWLVSAIQSASSAGNWRSIEFERDSAVVATLDFGTTAAPSINGGVSNTEAGSTGSWSAVYNSRNVILDIGNLDITHTGSWSFIYDRVRMYSGAPGNTEVYTERVDTS